MRLQPTGVFDNSARDYAQCEAVPLAAAMGAEIRGVDLSRLNDATFAEIADALYHHKMIFFRNQKIGHGDQEALTLRFGPFAEDAYDRSLPDYPNVHELIKEADVKVKMVFGEGWHTDSPFLTQPPAISILHSETVPPFGGDTIWCNSALAFRALSERMQSVLRPLRVRMSSADVIANMARLSASGDYGVASKHRDGTAKQVSQAREAVHPLIRTHPVTGEKALYVDETYARGIDGMTEEESRPLLEFLRFHLTQASFSCRLRWEADMVVLWDNRLTVHKAFNDYDGYRRVLYRTTVAGDVPA